MRKLLCLLGIHKWKWQDWVPLERTSGDIPGYCYIHGPCTRCGVK